MLQPGKKVIQEGSTTQSTHLHPVIQLQARMRQLVSFPAQQQQSLGWGHTPQRHCRRTVPRTCTHKQHVASSHQMLLSCLNASSAHVAPRRSSRHFRAGATPDWDFEFEKNPQNTEQPVVRSRHTSLQQQHRQRHTTLLHCLCLCPVSPPQVMPSPALSPREAVTVQLQAISNNDHPW